MKSNAIKEGIAKAPHRALLYAGGLSDKNIKRPFIGIASSFSDLVPGHMGMRDLERQIEIYLKRCDEFGHIDVSIKLNHFDIDQTMYESSLIVNYRIDQSFLPELIKEFSEVVKRAKHN